MSKQPRGRSTKANDKPKPRVAANGYRLPDPLPFGEILTDNTKGQWIIGKSIGCGGFGEIYAARRHGSKSEEWDYVVKVDHSTGPLYAEIHFYHRVSKVEQIEAWMKKEGLTFLGMPRYIASGIHEKQENSPSLRKRTKTSAAATNEPAKYRFLVMQRFGLDLQNILDSHEHTFSLKTAYTIAIKIIDILKYIHSHGYIHADIKASNLLLGREKECSRRTQKSQCSEIYLVDYGLVERYISREGQHREYEEDLRRAHNGTVEFTSRDAHLGALSRRSDLEILAYNVLSWLSGGRLPWMSNLKDHIYVKECKEYYMKKLHELVNYCFSGKQEQEQPANVKKQLSPINNRKPVVERKKILSTVPPGIVEVFQYIANLGFSEEPDYHLLKKIFETAILKSGEKCDGKFAFETVKSASLTKNSKRAAAGAAVENERHAKNERVEDADEDDFLESPPKRARHLQKLRAKSGRDGRLKKSVSAPSSMSPASVDKNRKTVFDNPTPAMLELLHKRENKAGQRVT